MTSSSICLPCEGIAVKSRHPLFLVDVATLEEPDGCARRLFNDLLAAVTYIANREAHLRTLFTPAWATANELFLGTVKDIYAFRQSRTYLLTFESDSTVLWYPDFKADAEFEAFDQIYSTNRIQVVDSSSCN